MTLKFEDLKDVFEDYAELFIWSPTITLMVSVFFLVLVVGLMITVVQMFWFKINPPAPEPAPDELEQPKSPKAKESPKPIKSPKSTKADTTSRSSSSKPVLRKAAAKTMPKPPSPVQSGGIKLEEGTSLMRPSAASRSRSKSQSSKSKSTKQTAKSPALRSGRVSKPVERFSIGGKMVTSDRTSFYIDLTKDDD
uniref:Uncharacterized protein n=1 Tax=Chromera velia CCMP2878 TaxID=1169474 RepID=A0A0G4HF12_9ALVE|mmetsp:Transcript_8458/g.16452  ORF Transcript_8458/g.16452 Transcript_8458/m.16452 type:complete len:194 (+) Transcript_8458:200-781(+)|eukprot:Cvel_26940.t1-p1 / transcript=Cvel_26940.t1 / gene=Cvel_26940 / organism=Chromera_velia_CCMP2878 / gene_product=hypothetical protein / transcript_product=hypothetical protein / location=Cvel_scaffold3281:2745-3323(-) / protein_length=193 / sequence_SO=supercontig / SO=protein_coding / is_pseudo=false